MRRLVLIAFCAFAGVTAPASAEQRARDIIPVVAYGEGTTTCTVTIEHTATLVTMPDIPPSYDVHGYTQCDRAVQQTARVSHAEALRDPVYGALCSAFATSCSSSVSGYGFAGVVTYKVTLRAPAGQGWITAPGECSGVGTDNLQCSFTGRLIDYEL